MFIYNIQKRREELGLSLQDVADIVGVNKTTVMKWENGHIENMRRDKIALLAKALKITPAEFMGWEEQTPSKKEKQLLQTYMLAKESDKVAVKALIKAIDKLLKIDEQENEQ